MRIPIKVAKAIMSFRTMNRLFINSSEMDEAVLLLPAALYGQLRGHSRHVYEETANAGL